MIIDNATRHSVIASGAEEARTFVSRLKGLMGRKGLGTGEGLVLVGCRSVHMWGMHFPVDVIFVDKSLQIVKLLRNLQPGSVSPYVSRASMAIELLVGTIDESKSQVGDQLIFEQESVRGLSRQPDS